MKTTNLQAAQKDDRQVVPTGRDVLLRVHILIIWIICFFISAQAQTQQAWVAHYDNGITTGTNQAVKMAMDATGNIYVTGFSQNNKTNLGYVTIKYAPNGTQLWASRYDSTNYPRATPSGVVIDNSNNVIVTGSAVTVKYDSNGNQLWTAPYAGAALAADSNAYIYVTGFGTQFNTVKLTPTGSNVWQTTYVDNVGPTLSQAILVDSNSNIYITGSDEWYHESFSSYVQLDIIKYDTNGVRIWLATDDNFYGAYPDSINVVGMAVDGAGNLYIDANFADVVGYDTYKYTSNGNLVWNGTPSYTENGMATGMALDSGTNLLETGMYPYDNGEDYGTFKENSAGSPIWTNTYPQSPVGSSGANAIAVDSANNAYVTGFSPGSNGSNNIVTIKYNGNGNQSWVQRYTGPANRNDVGTAIAVDNHGDVYVTGYDTTASGGTEIVTIKYSLVAIQRLGNGDILLQAQGSSGENFDIQASTNLQTWQDLGQSAADTNGLFQYTDTSAPEYNARYYDLIPQ